MTAYLLRRLGTSIIVLVGISIFIYLLLHADRRVEQDQRL